MTTRRAGSTALSVRLPRPVQPPPAPPTDLATDCRHYRGLEPCVHQRACAGCPHYAPFQQRVCIVKTGDLRQVIQSLHVLPEVHRQLPGAQVTWVSAADGCGLLDGHPLIDRVLDFDTGTRLALAQESFDLVINLDSQTQACALTMALFAKRKLGLGLSPSGTVAPLNPHARMWFEQALASQPQADAAAVSFPRLIFQGLGLTWRGERCPVSITQGARDRAAILLSSHGWQPGRLLVAVCPSLTAHDLDAHWQSTALAQAMTLVLGQDAQFQVMPLAQASDRLLVDRMLEGGPRHDRIIDPGSEHDQATLAALVDRADVVLAVDCPALHLAASLGKPTVALTGGAKMRPFELFARGQTLGVEPAAGVSTNAPHGAAGAGPSPLAIAQAVLAQLRSAGAANEPLRRAG